MRYFIITKRHITVVVSLVLGLAVITASIFSYQALAASDRLVPIYCVEDKGDKTVALSFDAAWGNTKKVQNPSKAHNYWVCASSVFHKNPDFNVILQ